MPPSAPPVIYTPPSPGSPPSAAGSVFEPAPAGKSVLLISGVTTGGVNGYVHYAGRVNNYPAWSSNGSLTPGAANVIVTSNGGVAWGVTLNAGVTYLATKSSGATTPDGLTDWTVTPGLGSPVIAVATVQAPVPIFVP